MTIGAPTVSVILPTYNRTKLLPRAICSVLGEKTVDLELIVVDDCSKEDVRSLVESYKDPRLIYIQRERNGGAAAARNSGLAHARGEYIAFQDSDDEWLQGKLQLQVEALRSATLDTALVFSGMLRYASTKLFQYPAEHLIPRKSDYHETVKMNALAFVQTWLVRRQALLETGPFDEQLKIWDDWDMLLRLTARFRVQCLPQPMVISYITTGSVSSDLKARAQDLMRMIHKYEIAEPQDRHFLGRLHYLRGRFQCLEGKQQESRQSLLRAIKYDTLSAKTWALFFLTFLGKQGPRYFLKRPYADNQ